MSTIPTGLSHQVLFLGGRASADHPNTVVKTEKGHVVTTVPSRFEEAIIAGTLGETS